VAVSDAIVREYGWRPAYPYGTIDYYFKPVVMSCGRNVRQTGSRLRRL